MNSSGPSKLLDVAWHSRIILAVTLALVGCQAKTNVPDSGGLGDSHFYVDDDVLPAEMAWIEEQLSGADTGNHTYLRLLRDVGGSQRLVELTRDMNEDELRAFYEPYGIGVSYLPESAEEITDD